MVKQIEVTNLVKEYQRKKNPENLGAALKSMFRPEYEYKRAVDDISFSIEKGESVGYVGPNGSGKSTTIKMLSGILKPSEGTVQVRGLDPFKQRMKNNKKIGVVFGNRSVLWWDVPVIESFRLLQRLYEIPEKRFQENLEKFTDIMGIGPLLGVPERQLSLGQKMRCNIAAAFLHDPEIVYLDEPTIGLDTESKASIRKCIRTMNEQEKITFLVTSHDFQDIESLCERIILINHGKLILDDQMQKVKQDFNRQKQIQFELEENPWHSGKGFHMDGVQMLSSTPYQLTMEFDQEKVDGVTLMNRVSEKSRVLDVTISGRDIESIIRDILRKDSLPPV